jgi:hypothetical protein
MNERGPVSSEESVSEVWRPEKTHTSTDERRAEEFHIRDLKPTCLAVKWPCFAHVLSVDGANFIRKMRRYGAPDINSRVVAAPFHSD